MKLYYSKGACSLAVRIAINELKVKCDFVAVDLKTKKLESGEDYLPINPKGAVPALGTSHGVLTENCVIQQYLADISDNHKVLPLAPDFERYRVLEMLNYITTELHKGFGPLFNPNFPEALKNEMTKPQLIKKFEYVEKVLGNKKFIMGEDFTLPDGYLFVVLRWADKFQLGIEHLITLQKYYERLKSHPSIKLSCEQEGL